MADKIKNQRERTSFGGKALHSFLRNRSQASSTSRSRSNGKFSFSPLRSEAGAMIAMAGKAPSAFFRKALAQWLAVDPGEHDWLVYPQVERLRRMIAAGLPDPRQTAGREDR